MTGPVAPPSGAAGDLPVSLAARPRDARRGLPIPPVNVHPDPRGGERAHVDFTTINTSISTQLAAGRRCSLCGESMEYGVAFLSTLVPPSCCGTPTRPDTPECLRVALTLCPHIARARHRRARADRPSARIMPPGPSGNKPDG